MTTRGIRGATSAANNTAADILDTTRELLLGIMSVNPSLNSEDVSHAIFTVTHDLDAAFPAKAARELGWTNVPLLCTQEIPVPTDVPRVIRVLIQWNTELAQNEITHVYLREAVALRPDIPVAIESITQITVDA